MGKIHLNDVFMNGSVVLHIEEHIMVVWNGGHTANVYAIDGSRVLNETDCFTFGHEFNRGTPELSSAAREACKAWVKALEEEEE